MLAISADWIAKSPNDSDAWLARAHALAMVHEFADAKAALAHASGEGVDDSAIAIGEATESPRSDRSPRANRWRRSDPTTSR